MTTKTPPAPETPAEATEATEPELGAIYILVPELEVDDYDTGGPTSPPPPTPGPRRTGGGRGRDDRFWRGLAWVFLGLLAFAIGGLLGEIGRRLLGPIGEGE